MGFRDALLAGDANVGAALASPPGLDISPRELRLRLLKTPGEIAEIEHLRRLIPLPAEVVTAPGFAALEKKEMRRGLLLPSIGGDARSAHCGSFRCDGA